MRIHKYSLKNCEPKIVDDLIRVGNKKKDGGYILSERQMKMTKVLIGLGINYDWTFEEEFKRKQNNTILYCFDFSIGKVKFIKSFIISLLNILSPNTYGNLLLYGKMKNIFFRPIKVLRAFFKFSTFFKSNKKNYFFDLGISDIKEKKFITIQNMFERIHHFDDLGENSIYIKMDIEGSEYDVLEDVLKYSSKINGMVIEFHNLKNLWSEFNYLIDETKKDFEIIHIHGNNYHGYINNTQVPKFIELSFIKRNLLKNGELNSSNNKLYPIENLDQPNVPGKPDLNIFFN